MTTMPEDDKFEIEEEEDEDERCSTGSRSYQHIRCLPTFSSKDWSRLLKDIRVHRPDHYALVHTMVKTGLPLVAVLGIQIGELSLQERVLRVVRGWGETGAFPIPNRSHPFHPHGDLGPLVIQLSAADLQVLTDHLAALREAGRPCDTTAWLFPGRGNQPWKFRYIAHFTILPALKRCGMSPLFPKDLYYCILKTHIEEKARHAR